MKNIGIEELTNYDVSSFIRDYLSIKQQSTPNINGVYAAFKRYVEDGSGDDIEQLLKELLDYGKRYAILLRANSVDQRLNGCIYRLNRLSTSVTRPFFLEALRMRETGKLTVDELYEVFQITESYIFRRMICDLPTNALNKIFLLLHREIIRMDGSEEQYAEKFKYSLLNKKDRGRFPTDEEFTECMVTRNIYGMHSKNKLYLFERLENAGTAETKDVWEHLDGFRKQDKGFDNVQDTLPRYIRYDGRNTLANRLRAGICELCGNKTNDIRMHHVRALKKLTGETEAERLMLHMRRKSLALCPYCYQSTLAQEP